MTTINSVTTDRSPSLLGLPVKEYAKLISEFLKQYNIELHDAEFMIIDGIEIPTQIEFSKQFEGVKLQGTVIGSVSEDQQLVKYEIWQTFETQQLALQFELIHGTETVSLYSYAPESLELRMQQSNNTIQSLQIFDQTSNEKLLCHLVRDTECLSGQMPVFKPQN